MQINKKYLYNALKYQDASDFSFNDEYNLAHYKTMLVYTKIVAKARWEKSGFRKEKLTRKELDLWLEYNQDFIGSL